MNNTCGNKRILTLVIPLFTALLIFMSTGCDNKKPANLTILHTNDIHGHFTPGEAYWLNHKPLIGGMAALDYYIDSIRASSGNCLVLDAGDLMTGNLICDMEYKGAEGGALIEMMNIIGYDGMVPGNHEFDKPIENTRALLSLADFPVYCANFVNEDGGYFCEMPYHIYEINGIDVGVIGITYHPMAGMAKPEYLGGFNSLEPASVVNDMVKKIDPVTDLIIVLSHLGYDKDLDLAEHIQNVDVIVGGHSHTRVEEPKAVNGILVVQAGSKTTNLGRLDLTVAGDSIQNFRGELIPAFAENIKPDERLAAFVDSFSTIIDKKYGEVIGQLKEDWISKYRDESNVGNFLTDAIRRTTGADVAFLNSGGIRKNIPAGDITLKDISEMLPFMNYVVAFECTGEELLEILHENAKAAACETHGTLQLSGVKYAWRKVAGDAEIVNVSVNGKALKKDRIYKIATVDYVVLNQDKYFNIQPGELENSGTLLSDMITEYIRKVKTIKPIKINRIRQIT
ncbi:MAG: hypothetical protein GF307_01100 [candidate division Zixibacteria bacterium]|nr:hypothetical protein [candidate division Zixibacteria bacterium]